MKKKTLLITGKIAEKAVKEFLKEKEILVYTIPNLDIASFLTPEVLLRELLLLKNKGKLGEIERIIVPGTAKGDFSTVTKELGIPCFKGPKCFLNLKEVLLLNSKASASLSEKIPADEILDFSIKKKVELELKNIYKKTLKKFSVKIGSGKNAVFLGSGISHVVAEINDAPNLGNKKIEKIANYYKNSGAEIIDIGMVANEDNSKKIPELVEVIRSNVDVPISIDTLNEKEILKAINSGIDLIISLDFSNFEIAQDIDIPFVIIPRDEKGIVPKKADERINLIKILIKKLEKTERKKMIVDLILSPINFGFSESLNAYIKFKKLYPKIPMLMGFGNVTELMDVDSVGVNGLLAGIASELNIDLLLTTEGSFKTKGCVKELSTAVKMMHLSKIKKQVPKDLRGIDLLVLKEKRKIDAKKINEKNVKTIIAKNKETINLEDIEFKIFIDNEKGKINVIYHHEKKPKLRFIGKNAEKIYKEILSRKLIKSLEHSAYLGKELEKAEIALKLGRNYIQDEPLFSMDF